jgi:hypothetical protein
MPPDFHRTETVKHAFLIVSAAWALVSLGRAGLRVWLVLHLSVGTFLLLDTVTGWPVYAAVLSVTVLYPLSRLRADGHLLAERTGLALTRATALTKMPRRHTVFDVCRCFARVWASLKACPGERSAAGASAWPGGHCGRICEHHVRRDPDPRWPAATPVDAARPAGRPR